MTIPNSGVCYREILVFWVYILFYSIITKISVAFEARDLISLCRKDHIGKFAGGVTMLMKNKDASAPVIVNFRPDRIR